MELAAPTLYLGHPQNVVWLSWQHGAAIKSRWKLDLGSNSSHLIQTSHSGCLDLHPLACRTGMLTGLTLGPQEGTGHAQDTSTHTLRGM